MFEERCINVEIKIKLQGVALTSTKHCLYLAILKIQIIYNDIKINQN